MDEEVTVNVKSWGIHVSLPTKTTAMVDIMISTYICLLLIPAITVDRRGLELVFCVAVGKMLEIVVRLMVNRCELYRGTNGAAWHQRLLLLVRITPMTLRRISPNHVVFFPKELAKQVSESPKKFNEH